MQVLNEFIVNARSPRKLALTAAGEADWIEKRLLFPVISLTDVSAKELPENVLIDRVTVIENNAIGMEISNYRNVTVADSVFNDNGERGAGMVQVGAERKNDPKAGIAPRTYVWRDCQFNHNNWRMAGTWGDMNDSAGFIRHPAPRISDAPLLF